MYITDKIKLIIWDLDETLWQGTLSEEDVQLTPETKRFLYDCLDKGIVHSVCSKNDYQNAKQKLEDLGIWDCFVFPSINWEAKGSRIKQIIEDMALRPVNVLFIDDNQSNLNEAVYFCPELMTASPNELDNIICSISQLDTKDKFHKRLKQYQILENKHNAQQTYSSNEEFLLSSKIQATIECDCVEKIDRILELIQRSNQLNYTKNRMGKDALLELLKDKTTNCGYVTVKDSYGDYGIVGFFAIKDNKAIHFTFSCRTLGMRIEQWTYLQVGCPEIDVVGEVVTQLNTEENPQWINHTSPFCVAENSGKGNISQNVLFKGPCDMSQIFSFINENKSVFTEFTYVGSAGQSIEGHNTTPQTLSSLTLSTLEKERIIASYPWFDKHMYDTVLCDEEITYLVFSMLSDGNLGIYRSKDGSHYVSLCEGYYDLTDKANWDAYINNKIFTSRISFTLSDLERFSKEYEKVDNAKGDVTMECLDRIYDIIGANISKIILLLGSEYNYPCPKERVSYLNRHLFHAALNEKIRIWAEDKPNVVLLRFDKYIKNESDFLDTINHFVKRVYYDLAKDILSILDIDSISQKGVFALGLAEVRRKLKNSKAGLLLRKIKQAIK